MKSDAPPGIPDDDANEWPAEPDEFEPESLGPSSPEIPSAADADPETQNAFWRAVLLSNLGVACVSIGPMLWYFLGRRALGGAIFVIGALALARTYHLHLTYGGGDDS